MDYRVERLRTPAECESFAKNAIARNHPELALAARRKAIDLQAATHETRSAVEAEAFAAVYAYEALLTRRNGKKTRATGTWQAVRRYGIIEAIQRAVNRRRTSPAPSRCAISDWKTSRSKRSSCATRHRSALRRSKRRRHG